MTITPNGILRLLFAGAAIAGPHAAIAETIPPGPTSQACQQSVNTLGSPMEHKEKRLADGSLALDFVIRSSNGLDYLVRCDAATGVVSDVRPRSAITDAPL